MNFQQKLFETAAEARDRAGAAAMAALDTVREGATVAARRAKELKGPLKQLRSAGHELRQVARHHVVRLLSENRAMAADAGRDLGALARSTYATLTTGGTKAHSSRKKKKTRVRRAIATS